MFASTIRITLFALALTLLTGVAYPLAVTGIAQSLFPKQANGSLIEKDGMIVGSALIAQKFEQPQYFHPRPSGAGAGYEANNSGASNLSVTSKALNDTFQERIKAEQTLEGSVDKVPADLITASGSGLDPHITPEAARYQAARVAKARTLTEAAVLQLIGAHTEGRTFGLLGAPRVNVLELNMELDKIGTSKTDTTTTE
jgi:K+-transporting ATPase ATPase C chain